VKFTPRSFGENYGREEALGERYGVCFVTPYLTFIPDSAGISAESGNLGRNSINKANFCNTRTRHTLLAIYKKRN